ncbi:MAG: 4-hydroxythreonine-4-phosphate dehydrogenase PdxA [Chloroflexota bacterium]
MSPRDDRPLLGVTMGDPTGAGPEVAVKALCSPEVREVSRPIIIGDEATMRAAVDIVGLPAEVHTIDNVDQADFNDRDILQVVDLYNVDMQQLVRGRVHPMGGKAAYECVETATRLALSGAIDAVVTGPLNKEALNKAGYDFSGHTEILAHLCGVTDVVMMLVAGEFRVSHVTTHVSLRKALDLVKKERILRVLELTDEAVRKMEVEEPRLAVAGLNPHAGEGGLFGNEEAEAIVPAVEAARDRGLSVRGPLPPDTVFLRALGKEFDAAIAMYHDQGHIPMKMVGFDQGVNVTLGLPILRTSVDHGTVFGKAGKGTARPQSLIEAIKLAAVMCRNR